MFMVLTAEQPQPRHPAHPFRAQEAAGHEAPDEQDGQAIQRVLEALHADQQPLLHARQQHHADQGPEAQARAGEQHHRDGHQRHVQAEDAGGVDVAHLPGLQRAGGGAEDGAQHQHMALHRADLHAHGLGHLLVVAYAFQCKAETCVVDAQGDDEGHDAHRQRAQEGRRQHLVHGQHDAVCPLGQPAQVEGHHLHQRQQRQRGKGEVVTMQPEQWHRHQRRHHRGGQQRHAESRQEGPARHQRDGKAVSTDAIEAVVAQVDIAHLACHPVPALAQDVGDEHGEGKGDVVGVAEKRQGRERHHGQRSQTPAVARDGGPAGGVARGGR